MHGTVTATMVGTLAVLVCSVAVCEESPEKCLKNLTESVERDVLEQSVRTLGLLTLDETQVQRLIDAVTKDKSDARRLYIWRALFDAQSSAGNKRLQQALTNEASDGAVVEFLSQIKTVRIGDVPLLGGIYEARKSDIVRDAIVKLATAETVDMQRRLRDMSARAHANEEEGRRVLATQYTDRKELQKGQNALIRWIVKNSEDKEHKLVLLRSAKNRSSEFGQSMVTLAMETENSPDFRAKVWEIVMHGSAKDSLRKLLGANEPEVVKLAGLAAAEKELRGDMEILFGAYAYRELLAELKLSMERDESEKVRTASGRIVRWLRATIVANGVRKVEAMGPQMRQEFTSVKTKSERERGQFLREIDSIGARFEHHVEEVERCFGKLSPEEEKQFGDAFTKVKAEVEELRSEMLAAEGKK